jgi:hypothetical protein
MSLAEAVARPQTVAAFRKQEANEKIYAAKK